MDFSSGIHRRRALGLIGAAPLAAFAGTETSGPAPDPPRELRPAGADSGSLYPEIMRLADEISRKTADNADKVRTAILNVEGRAGALYWDGVKKIIGDKAAFLKREHRGQSLRNGTAGNHFHLFDADPADHLFDGDAGIGLAQQGHVHPRVGLMAGHGRGFVVQDDQRKLMIVVDGVDQTGDAGMKEGGISDEGDDRLSGGPGKSCGAADARTHTNQEIGHL